MVCNITELIWMQTLFERKTTVLPFFCTWVYMVNNGVFWNNSKNIDIWILRKEQNLFRSEFYMCVPSLVKIDWEMPVKNPRWPPRNLVFLSFQHHTAVISRASSWSTCFFVVFLVFEIEKWPKATFNGGDLGFLTGISQSILTKLGTHI